MVYTIAEKQKSKTFGELEGTKYFLDGGGDLAVKLEGVQKGEPNAIVLTDADKKATGFTDYYGEGEIVTPVVVENIALRYAA